MADVDLTVYDASRNGVDLTANKVTVTTTDDYYFRNNGSVRMFVENTSEGVVTITVETPKSVDGLAVADKEVTLASSKKGVFGPYPPNIYNNAEGKVHVTFNQTVDVVAVRG